MNSKHIHDLAEQPQSRRNTGEFFRSMILSVVVAILLLGSLVHFAGPWNILANTRLLNVAIQAGIIKYHDRDAGFIEGVADHLYYLKSQEPVEWGIVVLAMLFLFLFWIIKLFQFHSIARYHGLITSFRQHTNAFLSGLTLKKLTPLHVSDAASTASLLQNGAETRRVASLLFLFRAFVVFEIALYALLALPGIGWSAWLLQMFWSLVILGAMSWWTRRPAREPESVTTLGAARNHLRELFQRPVRLASLSFISFLAFGTEDIVAYLLTMAFSTQQVLLHVNFELLLMAFVAGYIARQIPLTPGGIGQFEWGFTAALVIGGVGLPEAATVALLYSFFYYLSFALLYLVTSPWRSARTPFRSVLNLLYSPPSVQIGEAPIATTQREDDSVVVDVPVLHMPLAALLWSRGLVVAGLLLIIFFFDQITLLLSDFWLLESLGFSEVFWTNFNVGALLFVLGALAFAAGVTLPALLHPLSRQRRRFAAGLGIVVGMIAGYQLSLHYQYFLLWRSGLPFGEVDLVFGYDIGYYVFALPGWWILAQTLTWLFFVSLVSSIICANFSRNDQNTDARNLRLAAWLGSVATLPTMIVLMGLGITLAARVWLGRFSLLVKEDYTSSVFTGASYIDVTGLFSTLNHIHLTAATVLGVTIALVFLLRALHHQTNGRANRILPRRARAIGRTALLLIAADFAFAGLVSIRNTVEVQPNQPVIQLPYIERHITATRHAYRLDKVEEIEFIPRGDDAPMLDFERVMSSSTMRNAPLWPTHVSYLEQLVDPQHSQRILLTDGDSMIYGPTLETFRQQEKLRTYYDFMDIDVLRYTINGEKTVVASAARELPILEPQPWLAWWGQRFMLFTHGHGLVMAPVGLTTSQGDPVFVSSQIPIQTAWSEIAADNQQVYYGEGNASMAVSNVRDMAELDYPTDQGRAELVLPLDIPAGVHVDTLIKRIVFGWRSGEFWEMVFSTLITPQTRVHYYRQPLERLERIAPFLYFESNPYATIIDGDITWLVNAVTTSDEYPYSQHEFIGDKSLSRSQQMITPRRINYVEDSVKATINAATGQVRLYKITDAPVIDTWAAIYPDLFTSGDTMPTEVRQQLTYPLHLFHTQFDDLYIYYHMNDPMYFFNMEDMWDDADEVLGPVMDKGKAITFSVEPYHMVVETGKILPASNEEQQFVMAMPFTPEGARNLRALPVVYQDGDDYGRIAVLQVPKGYFALGPEQADAIIDQDPDISEQISWWNRRGTDVIRGHTSMLLIDDEIIYVEPLFIRSQQNSITQLKRVIVVLRGQAYMGNTLEDALRLAFNMPSEIVDRLMSDQ